MKAKINEVEIIEDCVKAGIAYSVERIQLIEEGQISNHLLFHIMKEIKEKFNFE